MAALGVVAHVASSHHAFGRDLYHTDTNVASPTRHNATGVVMNFAVCQGRANPGNQWEQTATYSNSNLFLTIYRPKNSRAQVRVLVGLIAGMTFMVVANLRDGDGEAEDRGILKELEFVEQEKSIVIKIPAAMQWSIACQKSTEKFCLTHVTFSLKPSNDKWPFLEVG